MKKRFSEIELDNEDDNLIQTILKKQSLNTTKLMNEIFQKKFNVSFDLKKILDEYLNSPEQNFCIYCQKFYLNNDIIECNCCDKFCCFNCNKKYWNKVIDMNKNIKFVSCNKCIKTYKNCNQCKKFFGIDSNHCSNFACHNCKEINCKNCMPFRFEKMKLSSENVHTGGGKYKEYTKVIFPVQIYCQYCIIKNLDKLDNKYFQIISS